MALFASFLSFRSGRLLKEEDGEIDFQPSFERALEESKTKTAKFPEADQSPNASLQP